MSKENQHLAKELSEANILIKESSNASATIKEKNGKIDELENKIRLMYEQNKSQKRENEKIGRAHV